MVGPARPQAPLGLPVDLRHNVTVQVFEDGRMYQVRLTRGALMEALHDAAFAIPTKDYVDAVWSTVHSPWDIGEADDGLYFSLWAAN